jgi:hypothetical protein
MKIIETIVVVTTLCCLSSPAAVYYVASNGSDVNAGSAAAPWQTIQRAANATIAGDVVRVQAGPYPERVTESSSGSAGNFITFVADGAVVMNGFDIRGSYVRVIGFEITHATNLGYHGISISSASHVELWDNNIHNTSMTSISPSAANFLIVRGNIMNYSGSPGGNNGPGMKTINDGGSPQNNVLIEYNVMSHTTDYLNSNGRKYILRNNVMGPITINDFGGVPHTDGWQSNAETHYGLMEANWHVDNVISDSHFFLSERPVSGRNSHYTLVKNVSLRSGDQLWAQFRDATNHLVAHNTVGQVGYGPRGGAASTGFFYIWDSSVNNIARNNIYTNVTTGQIYALNTGGSITHDHDLSQVGTDITHGVNGNIKADPQFAAYDANNVMLRPTSPAIDAGGPLTTVTSSGGTGTSFTVGEAYWFCDGFDGLVEPHKIYVGKNNNLSITAVDYAARTITVSAPITWANGDPVGYPYRGAGPDMGAYEFGDNLLVAAMLSQLGSTYTVTTIGDARFVVFYQDGIPFTTVTSSPYTATIPSGTVTAKAYALHAQSRPVIPATRAAFRGPTDTRVPSN